MKSSMKSLKAGSTLSLESMCQKVLFSQLSNLFIGFSANNVSAFSKCPLKDSFKGRVSKFQA